VGNGLLADVNAGHGPGAEKALWLRGSWNDDADLSCTPAAPLMKPFKRAEAGCEQQSPTPTWLGTSPLHPHRASRSHRLSSARSGLCMTASAAIRAPKSHVDLSEWCRALLP
jgi:hypothetical protein